MNPENFLGGAIKLDVERARQHIKAQIAANEKGVAELRKMVTHFTLPVAKAYMQHVQDNAAESVRRVIDRLHDSEFSYEMDQGTVIKVKITVDKARREATVDFTGTSEQQPTNFNAPEPVTRAAVLYVFRVMVDDDIPMNAGCLKPINIVIPKRSMLSPEFPAAVVAGKKDDAAKLLAGVHSAFDKAVKVGAITRPTANRKKSRLALSLKK